VTVVVVGPNAGMLLVIAVGLLIIFGQPFVIRFAYAIGPLSVLSVCNVGVLGPNGRIN